MLPSTHIGGGRESIGSCSHHGSHHLCRKTQRRSSRARAGDPAGSSGRGVEDLAAHYRWSGVGLTGRPLRRRAENDQAGQPYVEVVLFNPSGRKPGQRREKLSFRAVRQSLH
jgi:hypothetical protein